MLCEFLEVAVHLILYVREVYPVGIFQKRKKYNVPVQVSPTCLVLSPSAVWVPRGQARASGRLTISMDKRRMFKICFLLSGPLTSQQPPEGWAASHTFP